MSHKYSYVEWICDGCGRNLNSQRGFSTKSGRWVCKKCGYVNNVTDDNIILADEASQKRRRRRTVFGHALSLIEGLSFLGVISSLVSMVGFHTAFSDLLNGLVLHNSYTNIFFAYLFISIILYPIVMIISVICEKSGVYYDGQYSQNSVIYNILFNIFNDLISPVYTLKNRKYAPVSATIFLILWMLVVAFLVTGFIVTY